MKRVLSIVLATTMLFSLAGCFGGGGTTPTATSYNGVDFVGDPFINSIDNGKIDINMAVMYDDQSQIYYKATSYDLPLADGNSYKYNSESPMLSPVWAELEKRLNVTITNVIDGRPNINYSNLTDQWSSIQGRSFAGYDVINTSNVANLNEQGELGMVVNIEPFLGRMPNLKAFLDANPFIAKTIKASGGKMFYAPYFDGYNDIERMFIMRADWVRKLLDGAQGQGSSDVAPTFVYDAFLPSTLPAQSLTVTNSEGTDIVTITKSSTTNPITLMNTAQSANSSITGAQLLDIFKGYLNDRYGSQYSSYSDIFISQRASYDADELVALLRLVKANAKFLTNNAVTNANMWPVYPRGYTNDRSADVLRLAQIFGVRGLDSRNGYFFIGEDGTLKDARMEADTYYGVYKLNQMYQEGLILTDFNSGTVLGQNKAGAFGDKEFRGIINSENRGFMTYDYNQTTTLLNGLNGEDSNVGPKAGDSSTEWSGLNVISGFELLPVLPPFTVWKGKTYNDNDELTLPTTLSNDNFYRFTESWRSVKVDGWGVLKNASGEKLKRVLAMFDYMYTAEGQKLQSFGPDPWIANSNDDPSGGADSEAKGTITYQNRTVPKLATETLSELKYMANGNYTNYYRRFLGGTLPIGFVKDSAMEYQATHAIGKRGQEMINNAVTTGTLKHLLVGTDYDTATDNTYKTVPTVLPFTNGEQKIISQNYITLNSKFNVTNVSTSAGDNIFYRFIKLGFGTATTGAPDSTSTSNRLSRKALRLAVTDKNGSYNCEGFLTISQSAYNKLGV